VIEAGGGVAKLSHEAVRYLSLEGGGGKGVVYLGAVQALERLQVLPITLGSSDNQIKGVSGASAGAITALLLSLGLDSTLLEQVLARPEDFNNFFDGPRVGEVRLVGRDNKSGVGRAPRSLGAAAIAAAIEGNWLRELLLARLMARNDRLWGQITKHPVEYLQCLALDRGLFPGFAARDFFEAVLGWRLQQGGVDFKTFRRLTGVDLVVTGANVTRQQPGYFSARYTPDFPVADAVAISMSVPLLFKPVLVQANVPVQGLVTRADAYHGLWADGGLLNNLPIHAFDEDSAANPQELNPTVLGLRLVNRFPEGSLPSLKPDEGLPLFGYLGDVLATLLYPASAGQLRTQEEVEHTIALYTYDLSLTEFSPSAQKRGKPVAAAFKAVLDYFGEANP
jgi:predicted acylesterase/phospholipase RssA